MNVKVLHDSQRVEFGEEAAMASNLKANMKQLGQRKVVMSAFRKKAVSKDRRRMSDCELLRGCRNVDKTWKTEVPVSWSW